MVCKTCGTEIADKALICYRCGAATTDPVRRAAKLPAGRVPGIVGVVWPLGLAAVALAAGTHGLDLVSDPVSLIAAACGVAGGFWRWRRGA